MASKSVLFLLLAATTSTSLAATNKVICYYASWATSRPGNGRFLPEDIDPHLCTHINYAFLGLDADGSVKILDENNEITQGGLKKVSDLKSKNPDLKVLLSIGGASADTGVFTTVSSDAGKRNQMAQSAIQLFQTYNFDGLDVDWEYPRGGDQQKFIDLLTSLKEAFQPHGYLLTVAVNSIPGEVGGYDIPAMSRVLDIINVMTYDFHAIWGGEAAQNSPLYGGDKESGWQKENRNCNASITYWIDGGADPQKLALGVAFYGHTFTLANPANHDLGAATSGPGEPGPYTANLGSLGYNEICEFHPNGAVVFQNDMKVPFLYEGRFWVGFDNEQSVAEKVKYAKEKNLGGVFIWSIETDDMHGFCGEKNGLLKAVNKAIK